MARPTPEIVQDLQAAADALSAYRRQLETVPLATVSPLRPEPVSLARTAAPVPPPQPPPHPRVPRFEKSARCDFATGNAGAVLALRQPDWLLHQLTVTGPAADIMRFRAAAAGAGTIPWVVGFDRLEEDLFLMLVRGEGGTRELSPAGAHVLAGRVRQVVERRAAQAQIQAAERGGQVPFDLHALCPVPGPVLDLGPDHPQARHWLWRNWGTTGPLRGAAAIQPGRGDVIDGRSVFRVAFWSADWTPWAALERLTAEWRPLTLTMRPVYDAE